MSIFHKIRWTLMGIIGKIVLWLWAKSCRIIVIGEENYKRLRKRSKPVIIMVWHGRIFFVPYFFRRRGMMPLVSPSKDGEIASQIMSRWGYKIIRGSSSHVMVRAWNEMKKELQNGGEVILVPDGPRGPNRKLKKGSLKLALDTGAYLVPVSFSASKKKFLKSWDNFLIIKPFSKVVAIYGKPIQPELFKDEKSLQKRCKEIEAVLIQLDNEADRFFDSP
ncbi:MAG: lysophospholipid acyltransferase family protein [Acidobacteriota bacterium]|nr:lysophospholipid acyltransferase family protein [Acidobacteriota bacterium]